jgi:hypothetical protein
MGVESHDERIAQVREERRRRMRKEDERAASSAGMLFLGLLTFVILLSTCEGRAQDVNGAATLPEVGETVALERGDRAPWAGMLVRDEDLFALQSRIAILDLDLRNARTLYDEAIAGRAALLLEASRRCDERTETISGLWRERRDELLAVVAESRAREGPSWWEHPALWFAVGVIVTGALTLAVVAAVGG